MSEPICVSFGTLQQCFVLNTSVNSTVWSKKTDPLVYFDDNFGKYGPI